MRIHTHGNSESACTYLKSRGFHLVAAHLSDSAVDYKAVDYTIPTAIVMGTERFGVSENTLAAVDQQITIPMMGVAQSLNVSVACAVVLYEAQRQRQSAGLYDTSRLEAEILETQRFEWLHPVLAEYCRKHGLQFPALDEDGELAEPMPRAD